MSYTSQVLPYCIITDTQLSQEETDALKVVLSGIGVNPCEVSLEDSQSTLVRIQQLLVEKGYRDLATNLRVKLSEGMSCHCRVLTSDRIHIP